MKNKMNIVYTLTHTYTTVVHELMYYGMLNCILTYWYVHNVEKHCM